MDTLNPRRVMRGLERCLASGKSILELKNEFEKKPNPFPEFEKQVLWLDRENEDLERRISDRSQKMLEGGLLRKQRIYYVQELQAMLRLRMQWGTVNVLPI